MNFRTTLVLLVVLVALGAYVWFGEFNAGKPTMPALTPTPVVLNFPIEEVTEMTVESGEGRVVLLHGSGSEWKLVEPVVDDADPGRMNVLMYKFSDLEASRAITDSVGSLADYGLDEPIVTSTFKFKDGSTITLAVGSAVPTGAGHYAKRSDQDAVYLIPTSEVEALQQVVTNPPRKPTPTPSPTPTTAAEATSTS